MKSALRTLLILMVLMLAVLPAQAQSRSLVWDRWDVVIDNVDTQNNRFRVTELYDVTFNGTFRFGSAVINADRLTSVEVVGIAVNGRDLRQGCSNTPGTYCFSYASEEYTLTYYFPQSVSNDTVSIRMRYWVEGALRSYPDSGDQLWWDAIPDEHFGFPIRQSTVTVEMPAGFAPREGVDPVEVYGAVGEVDVNGTTVTARAVNGVAGTEQFSIRIQYPHNPAMAAPPWQSAFDTQRAFEETVQPWIGLGSLGVALVVALGGGLLVVTRFLTRGRDPEIGIVPEYLSDPPSEVSPGLVGTLLDERVDVRDILAVLLDLARRGYIVIEETHQSGLLGFTRTQFTFKRTDKMLEGLREFELTLMRRLFSNDQLICTLDSLKNRFYTTIPILKQQMYNAVVEDGFFDKSPETVRSGWSAGGVVLVILGMIGVFLFIGAVEQISMMLLCLPAALGVVGVVMLALGPSMPAKTRKGAEEAAKWHAFRTYMANLDQYESVDGAAARFADFIPYATAFGLNRAWINRFKEVSSASLPPWYWPTYYGGPFRGGYRAGTPLAPQWADRGMSGELARAGEGGWSLDNASGGLAEGLDSFSNGMSTMLDSAARTFTSVPQSSSSSGRWSSGGRSFGGGGFRGGGGSGGGSRGFG